MSKKKAALPSLDVIEFIINSVNANTLARNLEWDRQIGLEEMWRKERQVAKDLEKSLLRPSVQLDV